MADGSNSRLAAITTLLHPPEGYTADGLVALIRATDANGQSKICIRSVGRISLREELEILDVERLIVRRALDCAADPGRG